MKENNMIFTEDYKKLPDEDMMDVICNALRKAAESKAKKDWDKMHPEMNREYNVTDN